MPKTAPIENFHAACYHFTMDGEATLAGAANRQYKDRLFKAIFEDRGRLLSLYNAVNGTNYADPDALEVNTIENSVYVGMHNDLSFIFQSELSLYEQQSSYNPNMPLRGLMYFARLYEKILTQRHKDVYSSTLVKIPTPKYVVFYNGRTEKDDSAELRLSDAFELADRSGKFEWTATMLNVNRGHNAALLGKCAALHAYAEYVARVRANVKAGMDKSAAIDEALDWAAKSELLGGFFLERKSEVKAMSITEFDLDEFGENRREEGIEIGLAKGRLEGLKEGRYSMIVAMDRQGMPRATIAAVAGLGEEEIERILDEAAARA